ncbi:MAG: lysophospholipid acyltransferase family protein [Nitrospinae bacterium]|nr:lysophospholipid acyltransferase family protein [Nitrospinota bacterium]
MNEQLPTTLPSSGQPTWLKKIFQAGLRLAYGGVDVQGMQNVPPDGPLIVASNHRSYLDPMILASFLPRRVYHMAKRELFRNPLFAKLITYYGAFPVDREGTARASTFRMARTLLGLNGAVVIFPEGGIVNSTAEVEVKEGVATLAAMSRAPVLPVYIAGSNTLISPRGILDPWLVIRVGEVIPPAQGKGREYRRVFAQSIVDAILKLESDYLAAKRGS